MPALAHLTAVLVASFLFIQVPDRFIQVSDRRSSSPGAMLATTGSTSH